MMTDETALIGRGTPVCDWSKSPIDDNWPLR